MIYTAKIDIFDLPAKKLFSGITKKFNNYIFNDLKYKFGSMSEACNHLNINISSLYGWNKKQQYPLYRLLALAKELEYSNKLIRNNIINLKSGFNHKLLGGGISHPVYPIFPIYITKEFARIMAHIFGDGCLSVSKKGYFNLSYYNQNKILRERFKKDVKKLFGDIKFFEGVNKNTPFDLTE